MFTGIIEGLGKIMTISCGHIDVETRLDDIRAGDSIAVNGICLTVTRLRAKGVDKCILSFDYTPETFSVTSFKSVRTGTRVNLERALKASSRFGGHIVSGHVEAIGTLLAIAPVGNSRIYRFSLPESIARYVVPKGSIAIDGISLTVVEVTAKWFTVSVIPHTMTNTTLSSLRPTVPVNLEADMLARYQENTQIPAPPVSKLSDRFLKENGFL